MSGYNNTQAYYIHSQEYADRKAAAAVQYEAGIDFTVDGLTKQMANGFKVNDVYTEGNRKGMTALMWASSYGFEDVAKFLLEKGADVHATSDPSGKTALMFAAINGKSKVDNGKCKVAKLLLENRADVHASDPSGKTALMFAAITGETTVAELLLKNGADVNASDPSGKTVLMLAIVPDNYYVAKLLLDNGADVNASDPSGKTVIEYALEGCNGYMVRLLCRYDPRINLDRAMKILNALPGSCDWELTKAFFKDCINARSENLYEAIKKKDQSEVKILSEVETLLENGLDLNNADKDGVTALMLASEKNYAEIVKFLLDHKANPNAANKNGVTALMLASEKNYAEIVTLLLDHKANPNAANKNGENAIMIAAKKGWHNVVKLLCQYGAWVKIDKVRELAKNLQSETAEQVINALVFCKKNKPSITLWGGRNKRTRKSKKPKRKTRK